MKVLRNVLVLSLVVVLLAALSACGGGNNDGDAASQSTVESGDAAEVTGTAAEASSAVPEEANNTIPGPDASATVDSLLGEWADINDASRFAKIAKTDSGYSYEDNDGTYEATFEAGTLVVKVSDTEGDVAKAYIDAKSGHMFSTYMDGYSEFQKK